METSKHEHKNINKPEETRQFENGKVELVTVSGATVGRATFKPGWKWSKHVKPLAKTDLCESGHFFYQVSGTMKIVYKDGKEKETKAGDVCVCPPGHDAWVVGNEPVVVVDFQGLTNYAK